MIEIDGFLEPVAGANPCGENLYYSPVFDKIREARRQDDAGPMGQWERELKASDFRTVIKLSEEALRTKTKDLWLAAWLTEAWIGRDRIPGLTAGLKLLTALMTTFWDGLHPDVEEGDLGLRATPLEWLGSAATAPSPILLLKSVPLTENGVTWLAYKDARAMGYEDACEATTLEPRRGPLRSKKVNCLSRRIRQAVCRHFKAFYRHLETDCGEAAAVLAELNRFCDERFGADSPNLSPLRGALDELRPTFTVFCTRSLKPIPIPLKLHRIFRILMWQAGRIKRLPSLSRSLPPLPHFRILQTFSFGQIASGARAAMDVLAAVPRVPAAAHRRRARFSYPSIVRALRWGELRATNDHLDSLLEAPAGDVRRMIRQYANQKDWKRLLETAETIMASGCGRGWLDLQRYSILACEGLGYQEASKAIRSELKTLLADFPQLPTSILNDDTGAANPGNAELAASGEIYFVGEDSRQETEDGRMNRMRVSAPVFRLPSPVFCLRPMAKDQGDGPVTLSVLDRLIDEEPKESAEGAVHALNRQPN